MARGGYRRPSAPSPVSPPGSMSRRTDGGPARPVQPMTGLPYGENADFNEMQSAAPQGATSGPAVNPMPMQAGGPQPPSPLMAPSGRPEEPITDGSMVGPGDTPEVNYGEQARSDMAILKSYLPQLEVPLMWEDTPKSYRMLVAYIRNS